MEHADQPHRVLGVGGVDGGDMTTIQWTDETWNPVTGCTKVSQGCKNCYAERVFPRVYGKRRFTDVQMHPDRLDHPLRWGKPRRVFVNSMSDLFHESVPFEFIDEVFAVMAMAPQHVFQILTKRPERMRAWTQRTDWDAWITKAMLGRRCGVGRFAIRVDRPYVSNVWLGVSVEDQETADERIPLLLQTPAAVRFVSYEPALGPVDFRVPFDGANVRALYRAAPGIPRIDWVIVGGESGPKARPFDAAWARSTIAQCKAAGAPCFVKQLGANIIDRNDAGFAAEEEVWAEGPDAGRPTNPSAWPSPYGDIEHDINGFREEYQGAPVRVHLRDRKGGDPSEWPEDLRVREWPAL
jgi:protein gp37